ncbi:MAG: glycosyltransferase family 61 protein [Tepidisphaeraceae bacterium]
MNTADQLPRNVLTRERLLTTRSCAWHESFGRDESFATTAPPGLGHLPAALAEKVGTHRLDKPFIAEVRDVLLCGPRAVGVTSGEAGVILETALNRTDVLAQSVPPQLIDPGFSPAEMVAEQSVPAACSLVNLWSGNYFHWTLECLTQIEGLRRWEKHAGMRAKVIVEQRFPDWKLETLQKLGVSPDHLVRWQGHTVQVDRLVVPSMRRDAGRTSPAACRWLAGEMFAGVMHHPARPTRVYLSRQHAARRRVSNEDELMSYLVEKGFRICIPEEMTVRQQIETFRDASVIVAPHGAALTNLIYADPGATVVELFGGRISACYATLCQSLGLRYAYFMGHAKGEDVEADPFLLDSLLKRLLDAPPSARKAA